MKTIWLSISLISLLTLTACAPEVPSTQQVATDEAVNTTTASTASAQIAATTVATATQPVVITAQTVSLLKKEGCLAAGDKRCFELDISYLNSNQAWLNQYLQQELATMLIGKDQPKQSLQQPDLAQLAQQYVEGVKQNLRENHSVDDNNPRIVLNYEQLLLKQHQNIIGIKIVHYINEGGTRGDSLDTYLNFDATTQQPLLWNNLLVSEAGGIEQAAQKLVEKLTVLYRQSPELAKMEMNAQELAEYMAQWQEDMNQAFAKPQSFTFTDTGILFHFLPNSIGPYLIGEVELVLPYREAQGIIQPKYLQLTGP